MAAQILICRRCGRRDAADLGSNQQELANAGMLERQCPGCGAETKWGLAQDYRKLDRRASDRRGGERRMGFERRRTSRRRSPRRRASE